MDPADVAPELAALRRYESDADDAVREGVGRALAAVLLPRCLMQGSPPAISEHAFFNCAEPDPTRIVATPPPTPPPRTPESDQPLERTESWTTATATAKKETHQLGSKAWR